MSYDVRITRAAHNDILEMTSYISNVLQNKKAALEHMDGVYSVISSLREDALKYQIYDDEYLTEQRIRFAQFKNYMIAYRAYEDTKVVEVYGVLYGAMDLAERLRPKVPEVKI